MEVALEEPSYMYPFCLELLQYLFEKGLRIEDVQRDYAVVNAVNNMFDPRWMDNNVFDPTWNVNKMFDPKWMTYSRGERLERQLDLIEFLLEKGCNPNTVSEYCGEKFLVADDRGGTMRTALDQAMVFQASSYRPTLPIDELNRISDRLLIMLRQHGAKTGSELKIPRRMLKGT